MSGKRAEFVYDELLCFLGSAFFQVPVCGFIEERCLIFDPSVEDSDEYKKSHKEYKRIVEALLDAFMKDTKLTYDEVIKALNDMNSKKDIREIFQGLFEQVLAMDDLEIFVRLMTQKNIELQQQALMLIMKTTGHLPDSLTEGGPAPQASSGSEGMMDDDEIMRRVLEQSKREYEEEQQKSKKEEKKDKKEMDKINDVSKHEVTYLEHQKQLEKQKMNEIQKRKDANLAMASMSIKDMPPLVPAPAPAQAQAPATQDRPKVPLPAKPTQAKQEQPKITTPGMSSPATISQTSLGPGLQQAPKLPGISSSQAAAQWLQEAQAESTPSKSHNDAVQKAAAAMAGMSADEIKKRQSYLIQQRDKLIAMKKAEREKQLLTAEKNQPTRPMSSRAARQSMQADAEEGGNKKQQLSAEEQKKIEMRRTIANKLKAELMGGN